MIDRKPILFVHIPKSAGTSIREALAGHFGLDRCEFRYSSHARACERPAFVSGHCSAKELIKSYPGARLITCLREPLERLVSLDSHLRRAPGLIGEWYRRRQPTLRELARVKDKRFHKHAFLRPMGWFLDVPAVNFAGIIRFESLATDWPLLLERLELPQIHLPTLDTRSERIDHWPAELAMAADALAADRRRCAQYARYCVNRRRAWPAT